MPRISDLTRVNEVSDGDVFPIEQASSGRTRSVAFQTIRDEISAGVDAAVSIAVAAAAAAEEAAASSDAQVLRDDLADGATALKGADLVAYDAGETVRDAIAASKQFDADISNPSDPALGAAIVGRGVVAVDSIADLLALPAEVRRSDLRYQVKEYRAGTGAGGGDFYWDAFKSKTEHNGVTVYDPDKSLPDFSVYTQTQEWVTPAVSGSGCFIRVLPTITSMHFAGMLGNDVDEESALCNAALAALAGRIIYWPAPMTGSFRINSANIRASTAIVMSPDCVIKTPQRIIDSGDLHRFFDIRDTRGVIIEGNFATLEMTNPLYTGEFSHAINIVSTSDIEISCLNIISAKGDGIYIGGTVICENIKINQAYCYGSYRQGLSITHARYVYVSDSRFNATAGINPQTGVDLEANAGQVVEHCYFDGCRADGNAQNGFLAAIANDCSFTNCTAEGNGGSGLSADNGSADIKFVECTGKGNANNFYINTAPNAVLRGCKAIGGSANGIQVLSSPGIEIDDCTAKGNALRGITVQGSGGGVASVHDNKATENGQEGIYIAASDTAVENNKSWNNIGINIHHFTGSNVKIAGNWIRKGVNLSPYGIFVRNTANITNSFVGFNDCRGGGDLAGISLNSAQATCGHNINNDGSYSVTPN